MYVDGAVVMKYVDEQLYAYIAQEEKRQKDNLQLIASENYASPSVREAQGSVLTNKYAEGYPDRRYYGGCEFVDAIETLAIARAKMLFSCEYANVQPHSGSSANQAVMMAFMSPGDTLLGMSLDAGGHLTHGSKVSYSGKMYKAVHYGVNAQGIIDYDQVRQLALLHRPKLIIAGYSCYTGLIDWAFFREVADEVGAVFLADMAHVAGLVAAGLYPSPIPFADVVTSTTHKTLRGPRGGIILARDNVHARALDAAVFPGIQGGPLMHVIAAKAVSFREAMLPSFLEYQQNVLLNAKKLAYFLQDKGLVLSGPSTENHIVVVDVRSAGVYGSTVQSYGDACGISLNKNSIPQDPLPPRHASGIRLGTPAITTRGLKEDDMMLVATWLHACIHSQGQEDVLAKIRQEVADFLEGYPLFSDKVMR